MTDSMRKPSNPCACEAPVPGECSICGDEAREAVVLEVSADRIATISMEGARQQVAVELLDDVAPGDTILVQFGFAITRVKSA